MFYSELNLRVGVAVPELFEATRPGSWIRVDHVDGPSSTCFPIVPSPASHLIRPWSQWASRYLLGHSTHSPQRFDLLSSSHRERGNFASDHTTRQLIGPVLIRIWTCGRRWRFFPRFLSVHVSTRIQDLCIIVL